MHSIKKYANVACLSWQENWFSFHGNHSYFPSNHTLWPSYHSVFTNGWHWGDQRMKLPLKITILSCITFLDIVVRYFVIPQLQCYLPSWHVAVALKLMKRPCIASDCTCCIYKTPTSPWQPAATHSCDFKTRCNCPLHIHSINCCKVFRYKAAF